jgi:hypothetical protein
VVPFHKISGWLETQEAHGCAIDPKTYMGMYFVLANAESIE